MSELYEAAIATYLTRGGTQGSPHFLLGSLNWTLRREDFDLSTSQCMKNLLEQGNSQSFVFTDIWVVDFSGVP